MAPKGGRGGGSGGGGGGGSSISVCPGAFWLKSSQMRLARHVICLVAFFGISIALCVIRKKNGAGKKLLGLPYIIAVVFFILAYSLNLILDVLVECGTYSSEVYTGLSITSELLWGLAEWALLFVVVYVLNTMLRQHLGGVTSVFKATSLAIVSVMFALICADIGLASYNQWTVSNGGYQANALTIYKPWFDLRLAVCVLYLISVLVSGALSLITISALRSRRHPASGLLGGVIALIIFMMLWNIMNIVPVAAALSANRLAYETYQAIPFIVDFSQTISFIILLCIAQHASWKSATTAAPMAQVYSPVRM